MTIQNPKVILFSGGRTSGFMLRKLMDSWPDFSQCVTIFCNTGKERNETLDFVHEVETRWNVPVVWLEYHRVPAASIPVGVFPTPKRNSNLAKAAAAGETTHWFKRVDYEGASRNGEPFDELLNHLAVLPNPVRRSCSVELKIRTARRFLFSIGVKEYSPIIGIRHDEEDRAHEIMGNAEKFEHHLFPLIDIGITEGDVMRWWKQNDFDLHLKSYEGNCDLCFLKAKWKRVLLVKENPGMVDWWKNWEAKKKADDQSRSTMGRGNNFRDGQPYSLIQHLAAHSEDQGELCFTNASADIPCSCVERAFAVDDE